MDKVSGVGDQVSGLRTEGFEKIMSTMRGLGNLGGFLQSDYGSGLAAGVGLALGALGLSEEYVGYVQSRLGVQDQGARIEDQD